MLEKFSKKFQKYIKDNSDSSDYFDAHFHYSVCMEQGIPMPDFKDGKKWTGISCAHSKKEFEKQKMAADSIIHSFGLHPQNAINENIKESSYFLEKLCEENQISFIGEAGFDFFTEDFRKAENKQNEIWNIQLELALEFGLPLVIHCRKANHKIFEYSDKLKKLPEVLFHSFMGPAAEAQSILNHGINGYFSFGKQLMNGNKKAIDCVKTLPLTVLLAETDAPFQYLRGEKFTAPDEIEKVYKTIKSIRSRVF